MVLTQCDFCTCSECQSEEIQPSVQKYFRSTVKYVFTPHTRKAAIIRMIDQPLSKLKQIAKSRSIKDYKNKSKEYLTKMLSKSKPKIAL